MAVNRQVIYEADDGGHDVPKFLIRHWFTDVILKYKAKHLRMWHVVMKYVSILNPMWYDKVPHWKYYF